MTPRSPLLAGPGRVSAKEQIARVTERLDKMETNDTPYGPMLRAWAAEIRHALDPDTSVQEFYARSSNAHFERALRGSTK